MKQRKRPEQCPPGNSTKQKNTLQAEGIKPSPSGLFPARNRRVLFRPFLKRKGSLTVEAAVTVPVFLLTVCMLLGVLDLYRIQVLVKTSLNESAMELGMYAYGMKKGISSPDTPVSGTLSAALCTSYAAGQLPELGENVKISMLGSGIRDSYVELTASITYKLPVSPVPLPALRLRNESRARCWIGESGDGQQTGMEGGDEMVYVAEYESVYHTSRECTHIELAIHQGTKAEVEKIRNHYGRKYHRCEKCGQSSGGAVYYTEKGDCSHGAPDCPGLKRNVRLVRKAEMEHLLICSRCGERGKT